MNERNRVFDIIIDFIKAVQSEEQAVVYHNKEATYKIVGPKYLLGQIIRQYELPPEQQYISTAARQLRENLSEDNIWKYCYRQSVRCTNTQPMRILEYRGNEKKPYRARMVTAGDSFVFRDVFHDEHMIPIKVILEQLIRLPQPTYAEIDAALKTIAVCRILKEEDRRIFPKYNREYNLESAKSLYSSFGVEITKRNSRIKQKEFLL